MIGMNVEFLPMTGLVVVAIKVFDPCDSRCRCHDDSLFHSPCLHCVFHKSRVGWALEGRMKTEAETIESMPVALVVQIVDSVCTRTGASRKVFPHAKCPAEPEVVARHETVVLMWQAKQMADLVEVSRNADIGGFPTATSVVAIIGHEVCIRSSRV